MKKMLVLIVLLSVGFVGCSNSVEDKTSSVTTTDKNNVSIVAKNENPSPTLGNLPGNIANLGIAATYGEWEYFWAGTTGYDFDGGKLAKMKSDGSNFQILSDDKPCYINVAGDWLYYVKQNRPGKYYGKIIRLSKDGTNRKELYTADSSSMTVVGEWIYFINISEGNKIYKMKTDGSELTKLNDTESYDLQYENGWLYYSSKLGESTYPLYKINVSDSSKSIEIMSNVNKFILNKGWIYFYDRNDKLYRIKNDGTNKLLVYNKPVENVNVTGDSIFIISTDEVFVSGLGSYTKVYNVSLDGKEVKEIPNKDGVNRSGYACIVGDYIYYFIDRAEWFEIGRMKYDGSFDEVMINRLQ